MTFANTTVFVPSFTPVGVLEVIQSERATQALLVPTMIQMLVDHPDLPKYDTSSLRSVLYGASPISEALLQRALAAFPNAALHPGLRHDRALALRDHPALLVPHRRRAEGRQAALRRPRDLHAPKCGSSTPRTARCRAAPSARSCVRGPSVMQGYWNKPELTQAALRDGWMHTGDAGYMDDDGFVFIVDRVKDMIVTGGENVYSAEVENAIARHPAVAACAVIGIPERRSGARRCTRSSCSSRGRTRAPTRSSRTARR